ncbi:disease resistance protein At4g27190-like isoform X2 [Magnolia sinica]|uniref:disease resistance protein At4g27190-like isoform X2 n=2 Tax=Magnolia sinica TaxID=86752 RepID=UPI00265B098E|nr:disease resistance protein At4g27190-like isoform X2 [Magnolia sinica]
MEELSSRENDVRMAVNRVEIQLRKTRKHEVEAWLRNVRKITNEVRGVEQRLQEERGWLSPFRLGILIVNMIEKVVEIQERSPFSDRLVADPLLSSGKALPLTPLVGKTMAEKTLSIIWDHLINEETVKIGVFGLGGIGKTTIMKHINNRLIEAQLFDNVIWVNVSKSLTLERLQSNIAKAIELDLSDDNDEYSRSIKIYTALKRREKLALILDDMWEAFRLETVGVPEPNKENGCKLIVITRLRGVCRNMETHRDVEIKFLNEDEAWDLFRDKVGDALLSPDINDIAKLVCQKCNGLPLAIITVGHSLRGVHNAWVWRSTLNELRTSKAAEIQGFESNVLERLKFSYHRLRDDNIRACFLYCALFPEDHAIPTKELIDYWIYEGLIDRAGNRQYQIEKGQAILNALRDSCMFDSIVDKHNVDCVKLHDIVREMAISITKEKPRFLVRAGVGLRELPRVEEWMEEIERISLMKNHIEVLWDRPRCRKLSTLLLRENPLSSHIPSSFFESMPNLKVLDLSYTSIDSLPSSLSRLENLRALLLSDCSKLETMPSLAKLTNLIVLDLSNTCIKELPEGVEALVNLRCLDLSNTRNLQKFRQGALPHLSLLEDLSTHQSLWEWREGDKIDEITQLRRLVNLGLSFENFATFLDYLRSRQWRKLECFYFRVGQGPFSLASSRLDYSIEIVSSRLDYSTAITHHSQGTEDGPHMIPNNNLQLNLLGILPNNTLQLNLQECSGITSLSSLSNLKQLKACTLITCDEVECIVEDGKNILQTLEELTLWDLRNLRAICKASTPSGTLANLKSLHVQWCHCLRNLFSLGLFQQLQNLEVIKVEHCRLMEEMVGGGDDCNGSPNVVTHPNLKILHLHYLRELKSICGGTLVCNSLTTIIIENCPKLKNLPLASVVLPPILNGKILGSRKWWAALQWDDPETETRLQTLFQENP